MGLGLQLVFKFGNSLSLLFESLLHSTQRLVLGFYLGLGLLYDLSVFLGLGLCDSFGLDSGLGLRFGLVLRPVTRLLGSS